MGPATGILLGGGEGSHRLHHLLEDAFVPTPQGPALSDAFQEELQGQLSFAGHPLYALLHEAIYHDDLYVDTAHSLRTARAIRGLRTWVTDEFEHDGVRAGGPRVLDRLLALASDEA